MDGRRKLLLFGALAVGVIAIGGLLIVKALVPGSTMTSWWRSPWQNAKVGGVWNSLHQIGWAYDIVPVTDSNYRALKAVFPTVLNEGTHLHAQWI